MTGKELLKNYNYPAERIEGLIKRYTQGILTPEDNIIKKDIDCPAEDSFNSLPQKETKEYKELYDTGMSSIDRGELGVVMLNGGMATRFGGTVKGVVEVFDGMSFLELKIRDSLRVSGNIQFFIMNSFSTEEKTRMHMEEKKYFDSSDKIKMFNQYIAPRITEDGKYFHARDMKQSFYGPGHGDFPYCFRLSGRLKDFMNEGGKYIFFSNVDNLGARVDPAILGFHIKSSGELTAEVAQKSPGDQGGAPAIVDGKLQLVEGFSFPEDFDQSKISVFNCSTYWIDAESLNKEFELPWYVVKKEVEDEKIVQFEHIAGDMTIFLNTDFLKIPREERFYPIKKPEDLEKNRDKLRKLLKY
ncbi:UTP--glucose-1-phosphate uridylyltransferase [Elusimicrobiota bacterium]